LAKHWRQRNSPHIEEPSRPLRAAKEQGLTHFHQASPAPS
jgi:hypothetical protein